MEEYKDRLEVMFEKQQQLQDRLGTKPYMNQEYINVMTLAAIDELMETLRETPWKPWKKQQEFNTENYKEELVDLFHFYMNLCLAVGMKPEELYERYCVKNKINFKRKDTGY